MNRALALTFPFVSPFSAWLKHRLEQTFVWLRAELPPLAVQTLSARDEANQLRDMAADLMKSDPSFAQDLYAAADRHEEAHTAKA